MKHLTQLILFILLSFNITNAQYYVSKQGSDTNLGTLSQPFKTIQKAADIMVAGDVCYIMAGIYQEEVIPVNSGKASEPIVFRNYNNDVVLIYGTDSISGWEPYQNGIYKVYASDTVLQVLVDTVLAIEAAYPNLGTNHLSTTSWASVNVTESGNATFSGMNFPQNYWVGGYCVNLVGKKWIAHNGVIDNSDAANVHCTQRSIPWDNTSGTTYLGTGKGYITHHLNALDAQMEWYWQNDTLYYYPQNITEINSSKVLARTRMYGFNCSGKSYIEIQNINFVCASVNFEDAQSCVLKKSNVLYPTPFFYYLLSWNRGHEYTTDYSLDPYTGKGVAVSGSDNVIKQCYIAHSWGDGITLGGINNTVDSCFIEDCNWSATDDAPLTTVGRGHVITRNTMRHAARGILIHRITSEALISYNNLYDCGILCDDLGITYSYKTNGEGTVMSYNWIHDNHAQGTVPGLYLDAWDTSYIVHHNVIWNCYGAIRTNLSAINHQIYNNTLWGTTWSIMTNTGLNMENQIVRNNLSNKAFQSNIYTTQSNNLTTTSPGFTNLSQFDFTLTSSSPAKDYGVQIPGITDDYVGTAPDAGAYEYGVIPWIPGTNVPAVTLSDLFNNLTGANNESYYNSVNIFPNPTVNITRIKYDNIENCIIEIYNIYGQRILPHINSNIIDLTGYSKGLYFVVVNDLSKNSSYTEMIVLQ